MGLTHQKILGIRITTSSKHLILEEIKKWLNKPTEVRAKNGKTVHVPRIIVTPNPEQIVLAQRNVWFKELLNRADVALPDGIGLLLASRFVRGSWFHVGTDEIQERIHGVDFMQDLVRLAAGQRVRIGLIGGLPGLAVKALECLKEQYPRLDGWADEGPELLVDTQGNVEGPGEAYWSSLAQRIASTGTGMVFVGLGAPKQEHAISRIVQAMSLQGQLKQPLRDRHTESARAEKGIICMSVGGSFEMIAGTVKRAPVFIRSIGFEWFWRLMIEPWRWRRQLALIHFMFLVFREKLR